MINLKIKTLDSQDHDFSVDDDITVRQFKEHIAANTGISADMQRLIYCGRVLNDERPLREYDVNGKVVHLVERAPPRTRSGADSTARSDTGNTAGGGGNARRHHHHVDEHGNIRTPFIRSIDGVVMGAMAIPMNTNTGTTQAITHSMNPSSTLCMNRITVARHMLECVNNIVNFLENPERGLNNTELDILAQQTMESTVFEVGISAVSDGDGPQPDVQNFVQAFQGAVTAAFRQNGLTNIEISPQSDMGNAANRVPGMVIGGRRGSGPATVTATNVNQPPSDSAAPNNTPSTTTAQAPSSSNHAFSHSFSHSSSQSESTTSAGTGSGRSSSGNPSATSSPSRNQTTSPIVLAEVVQQMRTVQTRLEPYLQQYYDILQNEPTFAEGETAARDASQRVFDRMSEALHYMSHAQHAISDLMLNLSNTAPRHLSCRPILVEQSAYVSSGFAVPVLQLNQGMIALPQRRVDPTNGNNNESAATNNNVHDPIVIQSVVSLGGMDQQQQPQQADSQRQQPQPMQQQPAQQPTPVPAASDNANATPGTPNADVNLNNANRQMNVARIIQAVVNSVPMYADVHVEFAPRYPSDQWGQGGNTTSSNASATTTTTTNTEAAQPTPAAGNDQPRAAAATLTTPTTSTQTRSTARPQVHVTGIPASMRNFRHGGPMHLSSFDRFLPCNSHHVRENQERAAASRQAHIHMHRRNSMRRGNVNLGGERSRSQTTVRQIRTDEELSILSADEMGTPIRLFGSQLPIRDLVHITPSPTMLNSIRTDLHAYTVRMFGSPLNPTNLLEVFNQISNVLGQSALGQVQSANSSYNAVNSVNNLIQHTLPSIVNLVLEDDSVDFGMRLLREVIEFIRRIMAILVLCVGRNHAQSFINEMTDMGITSEIESERVPVHAFRRHVRAAVARQLDGLIIDRSDVQEFLVIRLPVPDVTPPEEIIPMETDDETVNIAQIIDDEILPSPPSAPPLRSAVSTAEESLLTPPPLPPQPQAAVNSEPLPRVLVGSENWHNGLPTTWLPVITRDLGRQRRMNPQAPYSDAYLSGMASKRRKLITAKKPPSTDPRAILTEGVRTVLQSRTAATSAAGGSSTPIVSVDEAIASNPHIHEPYGSFEQAIQAFVQGRISTDPDFTHELFPNCSKWINKKK